MLACLALQAAGAHAATAYVGEYSGQYSFHFGQAGPEYGEEAEESFAWDVRFGGAGPSGAAPAAAASLSAAGSDRFVRSGRGEDPEALTCSIAGEASPTLSPEYFDVQPGAAAGTVDVRAVIPIFTGSAGQVTVGPSTAAVCAALDATGAAVNCDPFGCPWECVGFAADPGFDGAWSIALADVPVSSFPRTFHAAEAMLPCAEAAVSYSADRSLDATLSVVVADPSVPARKPPRHRRRRRRRGRRLHSAGDDRGPR